jgi:hypothetical protein
LFFVRYNLVPPFYFDSCAVFISTEALVTANKRADDLAVKLEQSEKARQKAEQDAAAVGDLRKRLHEAEAALGDKITQQIAQEKDVSGRLESQNRLFCK